MDTHVDVAPITRPRQFATGKLVIGLTLLAAGLLAFAQGIDLLQIHHLWRYWPVALIIIGIGTEVDALIARRGDGGGFLAAFGVWMLAGSQHYFSLSYGTAFPIGIAVIGLSIALHAVFDRPANRPAEKEQQS